MADRYFSESPLTDDRAQLNGVQLTGTEAHHLIHVMRIQPGAEVVLFDGSGVECAARVEKVGRAEVEVTLHERRTVDRETPVELTLGVALPKGDRQKWLVEKAVELGVARLVPLRTARGVAQPVAKAIERLRRTVVEASKQCGRNRLMEIVAPRDWPELVTETSDVPCRLVAHPLRDAAATDPPWAATLPPQILIAIGPEGGFSDEEISLAADAGWGMLDLGPRILRIETAALTAAALVAQSADGAFRKTAPPQ